MLQYLKSILAQASRRQRKGRVGVLVASDSLESRQLLSAVTIELAASHDTTIYQQDVDTSNGAGQFVVAGGGARGLLRFDLGIPDGSTILDAVLTMNLGATESGNSSVAVHRVTTAWGEAGSDAFGNELQGVAAQPFDATWLYSFYDGELWHTPGGDISSVSATATVGGIGTYEWLGGGLIDDVQAWVDDAATNFGWLLRAPGHGAKAFLSKDSPGGLGPSLEVTYEPPPAPPAIVEGRLWNDLNGDGRRSDPVLADLNLSVVEGNYYFNAFGGREYWFRSSPSDSWYFLTEDGRLTKWSGIRRELSGDVVTTLDNIYYLQPGLVTQPGGGVEPWLDGWTVELIDALGNVAQTTLSGGRDLNADGTIDPVTEGGWYRFQVPSDESFTVRQLLPTSWSENVRVEAESSSVTEQAVNALDLYFRTSYYQDFGGLNEKWLYSNLKGWHYVTPNGSLYLWNGKPVSAAAPLTGTLVAMVGTAFYEDPAAMAAGQFSQGSESTEPELTRIDFGNQQSLTISGRVWLDFFDNGVRDSIDIIPITYEVYPSESLAAGEEWFFDYNNATWYIINVDGEIRYYSTVDDLNDDYGLPSPGEGTELPFVEKVTEPWLNGRTLNLVDQHGDVVATTTSRSIDLNKDGEIQFDSERGWYVFDDVPSGAYTVQLVSEDGWIQTSPLTESQATAVALDRELGFKTSANDFLNWGGQNERWLRDADNHWYYILEDGSLYRWYLGTRQTRGSLTGTLIATLSPAHYSDLQLLSDPDLTPISVHVDENGDTLNILFGTRRLLSDLLADAEL